MTQQTFNFRKRDDRIMSPLQLFNHFKGCNLYDFLAFMIWYFKRNGLICIECIETKKMVGNNPPDCFKCGLPTARILRKHYGRKEL
jgi:hypothetical protein